MLACARIGAPHTVVFGGFSGRGAVATASTTPRRSCVITADGGWRRGKPAALKPAVDEALALTPTIEHIARRPAARRRPRRRHRDDRRPRRLVARHRRPPVRRLPAGPARLASTCSTCSTRRARRPSPRGSCTRPRATCWARCVTHEMVFDIKPDDVYWCAADVGWVTGHSLHRLRAAGQRDDRGPLRGHARHAVVGALVADHRGLQGLDPVLRPDRDPGAHEAGPAVRRRRTTCPRCASWARSASRSTPRPGSGTTSTSAAARRPSSTRGGRPRPA